MKHWNWPAFLTALMIGAFGLFMIGGCDSGKKVVDEATGNRAVRQFHKSKEDIAKIGEQQEEKYGTIPGEEKEDK